jgi:putative peptidoglycan lipid II flippase
VARRIARNSAIFSIATGLSRVAGLVREIVASSYFGTSGPFSAFTLAFQVPNLIRALVADAAITSAFVPVFTELLENDKKRDAFRLASTLFLLILIGLGAITALFILLAPLVMPVFTGGEFSKELDDLTVGLSRVMLPIVVILALNGLVVGILNSYEHFTIPAFSPVVWNLVIIAGLIFLTPLFEGPDELYGYAIGVLVATFVQFFMVLPELRRYDFRFELSFKLRDERVKRVLVLMLPVTIGLGLINFNLVLNSVIGSTIDDDAPRAIDAAFRIYMLPQGMFSVAIATVLFPTLARYAARMDLNALRSTMSNGLRQICLLLIPAALITLVLAEPITRLVYQRGAFGAQSTELVSDALFWYSFSLVFSGVNLLLTRTFFSLQRPWTPTALAGANLAVTAAVSIVLAEPLGIAGVVLGTVVGTAGMTFAQAYYLRRDLDGSLEGRRTAGAVARMLVAGAALGVGAYASWRALDEALGRDLLAQLVSVGVGVLVGFGIYAALVLVLRVHEADQVRALVTSRFRRRDAG